MATDEGQQTSNGISRRSVLRGGLLVGAGVATVGVVSATGIGMASTLPQQLGWGHCDNCATMYWVPGAPGAQNKCAANSSGGGHIASAGSYKYAISYGGSYGDNSKPQGNWSWCGLCAALFFSGNGDGKAGYCAGNVNAPLTVGPHQAGSSTIYDLGFGQSDLTGTTQPQAYWFWCQYCSQLFWAEPGSSMAGYCPAPITGVTQHVASASGLNYDLDHSGTW